MFRLAPIFRGGCFSRFLPLSESCCPLFSVAANSPLLTSDNTKNDNTEIDLAVLFESCTKLHLLKCLHGVPVVLGKIQNIFISTKLVNHYANLGDVSVSSRTFDLILNKNVFTWNSMVSVYVQCGHFSKPYQSLCQTLFGRAGEVEKAYNFIKSMPLHPDASVWGTLLGACRIHGNIELDAFVSDHLFEVDSDNVGYYVLLSNIYANVGKWERADKARSLARVKRLRKTPGWSSIEVSRMVDVFYTGNQTHPKCEEIYCELRNLTAKMKSFGCVPDYSFVLQDVEDDEKEHILTSHGERLAIAFGIISTPPKTPIRISKNLCVCAGCHNVTKFILQITEREIIVRDSNHFHHFTSKKEFVLAEIIGDMDWMYIFHRTKAGYPSEGAQFVKLMF